MIVSSKSDSSNNEVPDGSESLKRLLQVDGLFGITYCGNTPMGRRQNIKRIFAVAYDLALVAIFIATNLMQYNDDNFRRLLQNSNNKGVLSFIFSFVGVSLSTEYLTIKFMLLVNGTELIETIRSIGFVKSGKQMYWIWIINILTLVLDSITNATDFIEMDQSITEFYNQSKFRIVFLTLATIVHSVAKLSVWSLLLYSSFVISQQLEVWTTSFETNSIRNPKKISREVIELSRKIERINELTGLIILVKMASNSIGMSGGICALASGNLEIIHKIGVITFLLTSLADVSIGCRSSQFIINSMDSLCKAVEKSLSTKTYSEEDYQQIKLILSLKGYFRYSVLNLFDLKDVTILLAFSYIINYSVILIQTQ